MAQMSRAGITWRDVDILQHALAENGAILPAKATGLNRRAQSKVARAIKTSRAMGMLPYDFCPSDNSQMPLMDPYQFLVDRLVHEQQQNPCSRRAAMLKVRYRQ